MVNPVEFLHSKLNSLIITHLNSSALFFACIYQGYLIILAGILRSAKSTNIVIYNPVRVLFRVSKIYSSNLKYCLFFTAGGK
jgi:hypothetical protein